MEISNGRSDPWLMPFARYGMRERATANAAGCSGVCGENAWAQVEAMNVEMLHQAVFFAWRWQARAKEVHENPRNGDFVSQPRFKVA